MFASLHGLIFCGVDGIDLVDYGTRTIDRRALGKEDLYAVAGRHRHVVT